MQTSIQVPPPVGHYYYCQKFGEQCVNRSLSRSKVVLTERNWALIEQIHKYVNETIQSKSDEENFGTVELWAYPNNGYGDCEDYALLKKRLLIDYGFPAEALLLTTARTEEDEAHVVLTVVTDKGDYILDNRFEMVQAWSDMNYQWMARQGVQHPDRWYAAKGYEHVIQAVLDRQRAISTSEFGSLMRPR